MKHFLFLALLPLLCAFHSCTTPDYESLLPEYYWYVDSVRLTFFKNHLLVCEQYPQSSSHPDSVIAKSLVVFGSWHCNGNELLTEYHNGNFNSLRRNIFVPRRLSIESYDSGKANIFLHNDNPYEQSDFVFRQGMKRDDHTSGGRYDSSLVGTWHLSHERAHSRTEYHPAYCDFQMTFDDCGHCITDYFDFETNSQMPDTSSYYTEDGYLRVEGKHFCMHGVYLTHENSLYLFFGDDNGYLGEKYQKR